MPDFVLLAGDVDAIKDFVFETSSLPQVRGGSQLLIECEVDVHQYVTERGGHEIYCSGGGFLFEVPLEQAEEIKRGIERIYLEKTLIGTVTVVYEDSQPLTPTVSSGPTDLWAGRLWRAAQHTTLDGGFAHRLFTLGSSLREARQNKTQFPFFEAWPFGKRCESCGKRMAVREVPRREPEDRRREERFKICSVCQNKHSKGLEGQQRTRGKFNQLFQEKFGPQAIQAPDLDHLIETARRKYLAFLYADGNDIGGLLAKARTKEHYQVFSRTLREGTQCALFDALHSVCGKALLQEKYWPFEIINIGGDDVTLLIQASYAWEVAVEFLERFEKELQRRQQGQFQQKITASCGIVITDVGYPMRYLELLANGSLKRAKKVAKEKNEPQSTVDFLWLPNPIASERVEPLTDYYQRDGRSLTARPYPLEQARRLVNLVQQASEWPRSQRYQWGEALERELWVSVSAIYYNIARHSGEQRKQLFQFLNNVGALLSASGNEPGPLWKLDENNIWRTALMDVLELAELRGMRSDVTARLEESA
jgi:hypothetical protein